MTVESTQEIGGRDRDELFAALADRRRRRAAGVLRRAGERLTLTELAEELARRAERDADPTAIDVERVRVDLYHRHLPRLADAGLVEFDAERRTATLSGTVPDAALERTERTLEIM